MRHDPDNTLCDKNTYAGADGVLCTCGIDDPADVPAPSVRPAPAVQMPAGESGRMSAREALAYGELKAAARELDVAKAMLKPAEERWRRALDTLHEAMLRP